jgi:hypothetical protein
MPSKEVLRPPFLYPVFGEKQHEEDARQREMEGEVDDVDEADVQGEQADEAYTNISLSMQCQHSSRVTV